MSVRGPRYGRRLLSSLLTVTLQTETGGANSRTAHGQAQGVLRRIHGWQEGIWDMVSHPSTMVSRPSTMVSRPSTMVSRPSTMVSGPSTVVSCPSTVVSRPSTMVSGPRTVVSCPSTMVSGPSTMVSGPSTVVSCPSTVVSCPSTVVSYPRTWLQQRHAHHPTVSRGGRVVPTAGCHILTSHTFSTELSPPHGGGCTRCCTFHSSAHGAQRGGEKQQADQRGGEKPQADQRGGEKPQADQEDQREAEEDEEDLVERYRNLTLFQRFKMMVKDYGHVLIPVHVATSLVWFGTFYYMAISGVDPVPLLEKIGLPHSWVETMKKSGASDLMVAYAFYKIATPARYTVTLGGTTFTIRYLRKKGVMHKPPPSKHMEKMKGFIQEKRGQMKSK